MGRFVVDSEQAGARADVIVARCFPEHTRAALQKLFAYGLVLINSKPVKAGHKLRAQDVIEIDETALDREPEAIELPVLYEDDDVVVINKPAGILTHSKGAYNDEATVASFIRTRVSPELTGNRAGIVHRLDRATSGVIICAKQADALSWLQKQFAQRRTKKTYIAIVAGRPQPEEAIIDIPIERNPKNPKTFRPHAHGKPAQTRYKVLRTGTKNNHFYSLVELSPVTGRTHQLRVHMEHIKHAIVGDRIYDSEKADRLYLHALRLELTLPSRERRVFEAPLPPEFTAFMEKHA